MRWIAVIVVMGMAAMSALAQTPAGQKPKFEVASVKPATTRGPVNTSPGGQYVAAGQPLKGLIAQSHRIRGFQVLGGPAWVGTDLWQIQAKAPEGSVPARSFQQDLGKPDVMDLMMQSLLEDRFQLKLHQETRQLPVYELVVAKGGSKLLLSEDQGPIAPPDPTVPRPHLANGLPALTRGSYQIGGFDAAVTGGRVFEGKAIPLSMLVNVLINQTGRPVIDKTNLSGLYDMRLEWIPDNLQATPCGPPADSAGVGLTTAMQEQLGLRLESTRGPVEVVVIDSVQRPSEN